MQNSLGSVFRPSLFYFSEWKREASDGICYFFDIPLAFLPRRIVLTSPLFSSILYPSSWTGVLTWCFPRQVLSSTFRTVLAGRRAIPRLTDCINMFGGAECPSNTLINHSGRFVDGDTHTNTIEGFWSLLKRAWYG